MAVVQSKRISDCKKSIGGDLDSGSKPVILVFAVLSGIRQPSVPNERIRRKGSAQGNTEFCVWDFDQADRGGAGSNPDIFCVLPDLIFVPFFKTENRMGVWGAFGNISLLCRIQRNGVSITYLALYFSWVCIYLVSLGIMETGGGKKDIGQGKQMGIKMH